MLDLEFFLKLAAVCAPGVAPETLAAVVAHESNFEPLAVHVNGDVDYYPVTLDEAVRLSREAIEAGQSVDMGLGQINSANLAPLDLTLEEVFDPCLNLAAAARLLEEAYAESVTPDQSDQQTLLHALSIYNTGDPQRGLRNGYANKVVAAAAKVVPALSAEQASLVLADLSASDHSLRATHTIHVSASAVEPKIAPEWRVAVGGVGTGDTASTIFVFE